MNELLDILTYRREHGSKGEKAFISKYLKDFKPYKNPAGEILAYVHEIKSKHHNKILWSCHIDTMHRSNPNTIKQNVFLDPYNVAFVDHKSDCLGADNGAGVWIMLEMIRAGVAGSYVFHRGEEKGCIGSSQMASDHTSWIKKHTHAFAFDRKGTTSFITHQMGSRCCSDDMAMHVIKGLDLGYVLDDTGVYTDTAEYAHLIPECVNLSVGYASEHSSTETLDVDHVVRLKDALIKIQWDKVPIKRKAEPKIDKYAGFYNEMPMYEDLMYMDHRSIKEWIKKTDPSMVAYAIQDLIDQIDFLNQSYNDPYNQTHYQTDTLPF